MPLLDLLKILKGSYLSGNFGHTGDPPNHGGSSPGGGHKAIGISPDTPKTKVDKILESRRKKPIKEKPQEKEQKKLSLSDLKNKGDYSKKEEKKLDKLLSQNDEQIVKVTEKMLSYEDSSGNSLDLSRVSLGNRNGAVSVTFSIKDKDGNEIGQMFREFDPKNKVVYNDYFEINEKARSSGFGSRMYQAHEESYREAGFQKVRMEANLTVGGYAWARMGYNFDYETQKNDLVNSLSSAYQKKYNAPLPKEPENAWEIAAYRGPDGHTIGKDVMLGSSWMGYKNLDESDKGYQVGKDYYGRKK